MKAKKRFWRISAIVAADSLRARTMPLRSPSTSVTPAVAMATSVPVPMAIPTSAAASAGASFTPSPAIATTRPRCRNRSTTAILSSGSTSASTSVMPSFDATARGRRIVAGEHDDADAGGLEGRDRGGCGVLDRVGNSDQPGGRAINGNEDHRRAFLAKLISLCNEWAELDIRLAHDPRVADDEATPVNRTAHALSDRRRKIAHVAQREVAFPRRLNDGRSERMLA